MKFTSIKEDAVYIYIAKRDSFSFKNTRVDRDMKEIGSELKRANGNKLDREISSVSVCMEN